LEKGTAEEREREREIERRRKGEKRVTFIMPQFYTRG